VTGLKLGKLPAQPRPKDLRLHNYMTSLQNIPDRFGSGTMYTDWGMLGNGPDDTVEKGFLGAGDCVIAGADHETMLVNKIRHGHDVLFDGGDAISDYSAVTGYVLDDESTDNGTDVHQALDYRRTIGVIDTMADRHKIYGYASLEPGNWNQLIEATWIFGIVGVGFKFPQSAMDAFDNGQIWDFDPNDPDPQEGHYVPCVGTMDKTVKATAITWARRQEFTKAFYEGYNDESYAILSQELIRATGRGYHGFNLAQFNEDLKVVTA
jgi:hypothetical protein